LPEQSLVVADYGQIELVVLADLIGHGKLFEGFHAGIDPHTMHAAGVLRKRPEDVTKDERQYLGKTLGFTIVNGAQAAKVAQMSQVSLKRAKQILEDYDTNFPEVGEFKTEQFRLARTRRPPYLVSLLGRKRRLPALLATEKWARARAERQGFNFLIQGGAADIMKVALIRIAAALAKYMPEAYLILTVHDEAIVVCPTARAEECRQLVIEAMTGPGIQKLIKVPLRVDAKVVQCWADAKLVFAGKLVSCRHEGDTVTDADENEAVDLTPLVKTRFAWDMIDHDQIQEWLPRFGLTPAGQESMDMDHLSCHERAILVQPFANLIERYSQITAEMQADYVFAAEDELTETRALEKAEYTETAFRLIDTSALAIVAQFLQDGYLTYGPACTITVTVPEPGE
jgi:hypothetical protein